MSQRSGRGRLRHSIIVFGAAGLTNRFIFTSVFSIRFAFSDAISGFRLLVCPFGLLGQVSAILSVFPDAPCFYNNVNLGHSYVRAIYLQ